MMNLGYMVETSVQQMAKLKQCGSSYGAKAEKPYTYETKFKVKKLLKRRLCLISIQQLCVVWLKTLVCLGLGLYIYAGEDLPRSA